MEIYVVAIGSDVNIGNYYPDLALSRPYVYNPRDYDSIEDDRQRLEQRIREGEHLEAFLNKF